MLLPELLEIAAGLVTLVGTVVGDLPLLLLISWWLLVVVVSVVKETGSEVESGVSQLIFSAALQLGQRRSSAS